MDMIRARMFLLLLCLGTFAWAQTDNAATKTDQGNGMKISELQKATDVVKDMTAMAPDKGVPNEVLEGAKCVAVIPKLAKGAFVVGGEHGNGVATCRTASAW